ncbi:MAG: response regulator [Methylococcaceae bacterium]|nr:response regulator [Methylococcaceae bacterium]
MNFIRFKKGIRWKLLSTMSLLVISLLALGTYIQISSQTRYFDSELKTRTQLMKQYLTDRAIMLSESLSHHVKEGIASYNFIQMDALLNKIADDDKELLYVILMNTSQEAIIHTLNPALEEEVLKTKAALFAAQQQEMTPFEYRRDNQEILEIILPIQLGTSPWGVLRLGFSLEFLQQEIYQSRQKNSQHIQEMIIQSLLIACFFILFSVVIIIMLSVKFSKPIRDLTEVANQLAQGDFTATDNFKLKTNDEIEVLAQAFVDMSNKLKDSYQKLEDYNHDLEQQVGKRTTQLVEARDQALNASEAKTDILTSVSHEIRNPMHAIILSTELVLKTQLNSKQRNHLTNVVRTSNRLVSLINDLLDIAKIEAGKLEIVQTKVNLDEILKDIADLTHLKAEKKGITLEFSLDKTIPHYLIGDPLRLNQIILNLVSNAIKFTDNGGVQVTIEAFNQEITKQSNEVDLKFSVIDTGEGLSLEEINRLFQSFNQANSSVARKYGGTGLGLSISKKLVEMMGGSVHVESEPNKGSHFYFKLSLKIDLNANYDLANHVKQSEIQSINSIKGARILVVDDDEINRLIAKDILESKGLKVELADGGYQALEKINRDSFDIILMDLQMPDMDGYEACKKIRSDSRYQDLPIIALSAHAMSDIKDKCLKIGMNDYLSKPFQEDTLFKTLALWVKLENTQECSSEISLDQESINKKSLECLAGVDVKTALNNKEGNIELFQQLLFDFADEFGDIINKINHALASQDDIKAQRLASRLKNESANLEAYKLYETAKALELAIHEKEHRFEALQECDIALKALLASIKKLPIEFN